MDPLASLVDWIALYGVLGLFAAGLAERFVPALPSHGMLVAIGMAAAIWAAPSQTCLLLPSTAFSVARSRASPRFGTCHDRGQSLTR